MTREIAEKQQYLLHWMYDFIEDDDEPAYLKKDVEEFDQLISAFINKIAKSSQRSDYAWICATVEALVLNLNNLNLQHDHQLIETHQREDICALINLVIENAGHQVPEDITQQWRQW